MTPEEIERLRKLAIELKRGMRQLERAYQLLANYLEISYTETAQIEEDEYTDIVTPGAFV